MQSESNSVLLTALFVALKPIARVLLKVGIGYREFSEVSKAAFVDVATKDYGLRGRPTNISRVAVMTGLTRKEVKRLRVKIEEGEPAEIAKVIPPSNILHQWHSDREFLDGNGRPLALPFSGDSKSFSALVKKYGGDIPPGAMRTELLRVSAIQETDDENLLPVRRHVRPVDKDQWFQTAMGLGVFGLAQAIDRNFDSADTQGWIQRVAWTTGIRVDDRDRVRQISRERAEDFVTAIDDLFSAYETIYPEDVDETAPSVVGVGVYYFESDDNTDLNFFDQRKNDK